MKYTSTDLALERRRVYITMWLKSLIVAVMLMVVVGGATRLTHSGLSMVQWKPLAVLPPLAEAGWKEEFALYQQTPEFCQINQGMTLVEFKQIYWWEYGHRLLGRLVGVLALLPLLWVFKNLPTWLRWWIATVFALGGLQGAIGWWMVKSGLKADPAVSHIRLCVHLVMAFLILTVLAKALWRAQGLQFNRLQFKDGVLLSAISLTIVYGALVAGLKAGLLYNTFPLMAGQLLPGEWNFYTPIWLNFINNGAMVQWVHRVLASATLGYCTFLWVRHGTNYRLLTIKLIIQVLLGIATLLLQVPLILALLHQAWAMIVWLVALRTVSITAQPYWLAPTAPSKNLRF